MASKTIARGVLQRTLVPFLPVPGLPEVVASFIEREQHVYHSLTDESTAGEVADSVWWLARDGPESLLSRISSIPAPKAIQNPIPKEVFIAYAIRPYNNRFETYKDDNLCGASHREDSNRQGACLEPLGMSYLLSQFWWRRAEAELYLPDFARASCTFPQYLVFWTITSRWLYEFLNTWGNVEDFIHAIVVPSSYHRGNWDMLEIGILKEITRHAIKNSRDYTIEQAFMEISLAEICEFVSFAWETLEAPERHVYAQEYRQWLARHSIGG